jgi:hypothetical protein
VIATSIPSRISVQYGAEFDITLSLVLPCINQISLRDPGERAGWPSRD